VIVTYNKQQVGDVLMIIMQDEKKQPVSFTRVGDVTRIFLQANDEATAFNLFNASKHLGEISGNGEIALSAQQLDKLNCLIAEAGFSDVLQYHKPRIVTAQVLSLAPHPDSNHLKVAQVDIATEVIQIVAGAPNIEVGQIVVACLDGSMLPSGKLIFAGELRGVKSAGMLASARELSLPNAPQKRGILVLPQDTKLGIPFNPTQHWQG
jgi:tRNA-binding protein